MTRISVDDRVEICLAIAHDLASNAAYYVAEVQKRTTGADGYLRTTYVCEHEAATADRIACAMLSDVGPLLREALRSRTEGLDASTATPCWLTIREPDGSTLHHVAFCLQTSRDGPVNMLEKIDVATEPADGKPELAGPAATTAHEDTTAKDAPEDDHAFSAPPDDIFAGRGGDGEDAREASTKSVTRDPNEVLDGFAKIIKARRLSRDLQQQRDSYLSDSADKEEIKEAEETQAPPDEAHPAGGSSDHGDGAGGDESGDIYPGETDAREPTAVGDSTMDVSEPPESSPAPADPRTHGAQPSASDARPSQARAPSSRALAAPGAYRSAFAPGPCPHSSRTVAKALGIRHASNSPRPSGRAASPAAALASTAGTRQPSAGEERRRQYYASPASQPRGNDAPAAVPTTDNGAAHSQPHPERAVPSSQPPAPLRQPQRPVEPQSSARALPAATAPSAAAQRASGAAPSPTEVPRAAAAPSAKSRSRSQSSVFRVAPFQAEPSRPSEISRPSRGSRQDPDEDVHRDSFSSYRQDLWRHADSVMTVATALDDFEQNQNRDEL